MKKASVLQGPGAILKLAEGSSMENVRAVTKCEEEEVRKRDGPERNGSFVQAGEIRGVLNGPGKKACLRKAQKEATSGGERGKRS